MHYGDPINLAWQSFAVTRLELSYLVKQQQEVALDSLAGQISLSSDSFSPSPAPLSSTAFYLDAYDAHGNKVDSKSIPISVIDPPIKIESFTASSQIANFAAGPVDITLTWSVTPVEMIKSLEIEGLADVTGQTSYVARAVTEPGTISLRAIGLASDQHVASAEVRALQDYLVGRTYGLMNYEDDNSDNERWATDMLEILSPSQAQYTVVKSDWHDIEEYGKPEPGWPRVYVAAWTLTGDTIEIVTPAGTLHFVYNEDPYWGEILEFQTPTFTSEISWRDDFNMKPGQPRP